jgi:MoxR-like ATPase
MPVDVKGIEDRVRAESRFAFDLKKEMERVIVGQRHMLDRLLVGLLSNGHVLLEGVPGLAKTTAVMTLARAIHARFQRIQFTPDLLPADLVGTLVYNPKSGEFTTKKGPIFANLVLADEINRAPAKVQSALLEAMQERRVTIGTETFDLPQPFLVLATQNPIEQEGTYTLPEAQVDRFMLKLKIEYPNREEERLILDRMAFTDQTIDVSPVVSPEQIVRARAVVNDVYVDEKVRDYVVNVVMATRDPAKWGVPIADYVRYGASPRATIFLTLAAKAHAFLEGRGYVTPQDVKSIGMDVLRHRILLTYEAEAEDKTPEDLVRAVFDHVAVP